MLAYSCRLTEKTAISHIFRHGRSIVGREIILKFLPNWSGATRIVVLVGTKLSSKAVLRNRIKRRLREAARQNFSVLPKSLDLLIIARTSKLSALDYADLRQKLLQLFLKLPH